MEATDLDALLDDFSVPWDDPFRDVAKKYIRRTPEAQGLLMLLKVTRLEQQFTEHTNTNVVRERMIHGAMTFGLAGAWIAYQVFGSPEPPWLSP